MATKKELNDEANELNLKWRREEIRRTKAEAALRTVVAAANKLIGEVETAGEHGYLGIQDDTYNKLAAETSAAREVLK